MSHVQRIALLMTQDTGFNRQALLGVRAFAIARREWLMHNAPPESASLGPLREWQPHGIIAHLVDRKFTRAVLKLDKPVVDIACAYSDLNVPVVDVDHAAVGRLAAEHFLQRGYKTFGYFGSATVRYSRLREASFRQTLAAAGFEVSACHVDYAPRLPVRTSWKTVNRQIRQWLKDLHKPVAVLAANDVPGRDLSSMCHQLDLRIPDDVAVLGVDDDELECQLSFPPLSSVAIPAERIGYEAARILDRMLAGRPVSREPLFLPPTRVVARHSTSALAVEDPLVAAAMHFIRRHVADRMSVAHIAAELAVRRRALEKKFHACLGASVLAEIHRVRVNEAKELLAVTDLKVSQVARRTGFSTPQRLAVVFRRLEGMTPNAYRRQSGLPERD
jgi:LacI family transcriptional regulator